MKRIFLACALLVFVTRAWAVDRVDLEQRVRVLISKLDTLQRDPTKSIPIKHLAKAQGIILLDRTKAGFLFAFQGGNGVALVRDPNTQKWSPPAFLSATEASLGFQIGGEQSFFVILLMTKEGARSIGEGRFEFGGEARGTAGESSAGEQATTSTDDRPVLVYSSRKGLYGGAAIKGGSISPDLEADRIYYGKAVTMDDILFAGKVEPTDTTTELAKKLDNYSHETPK
jgi:SH3 domain-containing YSC84-like protein 1